MPQVLRLASHEPVQPTLSDRHLQGLGCLVYVLRKFETEVKSGDIGLPDVMSVFKAWSDSVDSAFTHVRFGSRNNQALAFVATKDGFAVATGGADLPSVPSEPKLGER